MQYHWCPSEIVDNGLSSSRIWSYWLIVNDKRKCTALLIMRWGEAHSTSLMMVGNDVILWWAIILGSLDRWGSFSDQVQFSITWGHVLVIFGSHDCGSMWVHGFICPKVHIHNIESCTQLILQRPALRFLLFTFAGITRIQNLSVLFCSLLFITFSRVKMHLSISQQISSREGIWRINWMQHEPKQSQNICDHSKLFEQVKDTLEDLLQFLHDVVSLIV
jgi:hypothetical protein